MFSPRPSGAPAPPRWTALPTQCAVCRGWSGRRLCGACLDRFAAPVSRCARCAVPLPAAAGVCGACLRDPPPFASTLAAVDYAYPWDALIAQFKFQAALDLAPVLAARVAAAWRHGGMPRPDVLLPVALGPARLRERGYNQAWELARRVAPQVGCDADARTLLRTRDAAHQAALPRSTRADNVRGVFAVDARRAQALRGRHVALMDDVMTTGATAAEAARAVLAAGAASVRVWVLARTPPPGET